MKPLALLLLCAFAAHAASLPEAAKIDSFLAADWEKNGLQPNPPASDDVLVRRLYLDITGRIPTLEERDAFIQSNDPQKRTKLIDTLLASFFVLFIAMLAFPALSFIFGWGRKQ